MKVSPRVLVTRHHGTWRWLCLDLACVDHNDGYHDPGSAADHGRTHHRLWHTDS